MKRYMSTIIVGIIFICGLSLFLYPTLSNLYNEYLNKQLIGDYKEAFSDIKPEQYEKAMSEVLFYNKNRSNPEKLEEFGLTYENVLNVAGNGIMGYIEIPKISVSLVIYHTIDEDVLQSGVGHVEGTDLPIGGENTHCVLAGHTGLPSAKLLTNMDHLEVGDVFYVHVLDEVLQYQIDDVSVVEPYEVERLDVVDGKDYITLVTCTPYGVNSHRLLVRGSRVSAKGELDSDEMNVQNDLLEIDMTYLVTFSLIGLGIVSFIGSKIISVIKRHGRKGKGGQA